MGQAEMAYLRMHGALDRNSVEDGAAPDSGSNSQVEAAGHVAGGAPLGFSDCRGIYICAEADGDVQSAAWFAREIDVLPARLWGRCYVAVMRRSGVEVDR